MVPGRDRDVLRRCGARQPSRPRVRSRRAGGRKGRPYGAGARRAGLRRCGTRQPSRPRVRSRRAGGRKGRPYGAGARRAGLRRCGTRQPSRPRVRSRRAGGRKGRPYGAGPVERGYGDAGRVSFLVHASDLGGRAAARAAPTARGARRDRLPWYRSRRRSSSATPARGALSLVGFRPGGSLRAKRQRP